jgi:guanosine-3',5'-bis(diphosphate) 3'-pyrophosphohydrolase
MEPLLEKARDFALKAHGDQTYGPYPYRHHLEAVAANAREFGFPLAAVAAAWLHDTVEDTEVTREEIEREFGPEVAALVEGVTNEYGRNRAERKARTMPKTKAAGKMAVGLKLADRIANVTACLDDRDPKNTSMLRCYRREHPAFRAGLRTEGEWDELWAKLDELLV